MGLVLGQQNFGPLCAAQQGRRSRRQTNSVGGRACALAARGSISKAMKGLVLRRVQRTAAGTGPQPSFHGARVLELIPPVRSVLRRPGWPGRRAMQTGAERDEGRSNTGIPSLSHVKLSPVSAPGPTGAGTPGCHCLLRRSWLEETLVSGARHSHNQVGDRRLARGAPLLARYTVDVPEEGEGPDLEAVR